jgi:hypothetical protein
MFHVKKISFFLFFFYFLFSFSHLFVSVKDPVRVVYQVYDWYDCVEKLVQTTLRAIVGDMVTKKTKKERKKEEKKREKKKRKKSKEKDLLQYCLLFFLGS